MPRVTKTLFAFGLGASFAVAGCSSGDTPRPAPSTSTEASPAPTEDPRLQRVRAIGESIIARYQAARDADRAADLAGGPHAGVIVRAAGGCVIRLDLYSHRMHDRLNLPLPYAVESVDGSVACPNQPTTRIGATVPLDGRSINTTWSQTNGQNESVINTFGSQVYLGGPSPVANSAALAPSIQDQTLNELHALANVGTGGALPLLPQPRV